LLAAKQLNISVPEQLGIVGFANEPFTEYVSPSLSTIDQRAEQMGATVAQVILDEIESPSKIHDYKSIIIASQLIIRESSNRLRNNC
jgi:LacI family transcriptional regulator